MAAQPFPYPEHLHLPAFVREETVKDEQDTQTHEYDMDIGCTGLDTTE